MTNYLIYFNVLRDGYTCQMELNLTLLENETIDLEKEVMSAINDWIDRQYRIENYSYSLIRKPIVYCQTDFGYFKV